MKQLKLFALLLLATVAMVGCSKDYDDTSIKKDISDLQSRVEKLETWCTSANSQIEALKVLVEAVDARDYVTGTSAIVEGAETVGYTITFAKSGTISIMNGKNGANGVDGITPIIGVAKHTDGLYYWTVKTGDADATWLFDADGKMIRTTGDSGASATAPKITIDTFEGALYWKVDGEWLMNGNNKVPATGAKGDKGDTGSAGSAGAAGKDGDSVFAANGVKVNDDNTVTFTLAGTNGAVFTLPCTTQTMIFDSFTEFKIASTTATDLTLALTIKAADYKAIKAELTNSVGLVTTAVKTRAAGDAWDIAITAPTFNADGTINVQPVVKITVPAETTEKDIALLKVTIIDAKGAEHCATRVLVYSTAVDVESVTIDETLAINVGEEQTLTATVLPTGATQTVTWTSSDATIATVDANGKVTGKKAGTATIKAASTDDATKFDECTVTVENIALTNIALTDGTISIGTKTTLVPAFTPTDATIKTVTWSSSDAAIATVSATGEVEGKTAGEVTITATSTEYPSITGTCKVKVEDKPNYIEVNGIKVAIGNLVANGANGAKIGAPTDGGLYFQFGSLIGWAGGASGDGTGVPPSSPSYAFNATGTVVPSGNNIPATWGDPDSWTGATGTVPAANDPCTHYLGSGWRLPTTDEYKTLFNNTTSGWAGSDGWDWNADSKSATHTSGSKFPASGYRGNRDGSLGLVGTNGYCWSSSPDDGSRGYLLVFYSSGVSPSLSNSRAIGLPVRCVQASN